MNLYAVLINNQIPFNLIENNNNTENVIFCNQFNDHLFNVGVFSTKEKDIILEYTTRDEEKYVELDITFEDGRLFKKIPFKVVVDESIKDLPYCSFNSKTLLDVPSTKVEAIHEKEHEQEILEESLDSNTEEVILKEERESLLEKKKEYTSLIQEAKNAEKEFLKQKKELEKQKVLIEKQKIIDNKVDKIKDSLLKDYFNATKEQEKILNESINNNLNSLEAKLVETLERYSEKLEENEEKINDKVNLHFIDLKLENTALIKEKVETQIELYKKDFEKFLVDEINFTETQINEKISLSEKNIEGVIEETKNNLEEFVEEEILNSQEKTNNKIDKKIATVVESTEQLKEKLYKLQKEHEEKIGKKLLEYRDRVYKEFLIKAEKNTNDLVSKIIEEKLNRNEKDSIKKTISEEINKELKKYVDDSVNSAKTYARRILELGGGGGSVAVQLANGGSINGDLNVTGIYLSGGKNLFEIFSTSGNSEVNSVVHAGSANWNSTYSTVYSNSSFWNSTYNTIQDISGDWATYDYVYGNYLNLTGGTLNGDLTINGHLTALSSAYFVNTVFTTTSALSVVNIGVGPALYVYQAAGPYDVASFYDGDGIEVLHVGNAQLNGLGKIGINTGTPAVELTVNGAISGNSYITVDGGSSFDWNSVVTTVSTFSSSWEETATIIPTVTDYLSTNNVLLSAATVETDINVNGIGYFSHIAAATKSFYIVHPSDKTKHLQYGSLESPYHGIRFTGRDKISTVCTIKLPDYIKDLVKQDGINVQITNINHTQVLYVKSIDIDNNFIEIGRDYNLFNRNKSYEFYWSFTAIRKDIPDLKTVL